MKIVAFNFKTWKLGQTIAEAIDKLLLMANN